MCGMLPDRESSRLDTALIQRLHTRRYYVQIHSEHKPAGEIRGWLLLEES